MDQQQQPDSRPYRLDPCPTEERVGSSGPSTEPDLYRRGETTVSSEGITYQPCGGGRRIIKKKIGD